MLQHNYRIISTPKSVSLKKKGKMKRVKRIADEAEAGPEPAAVAFFIFFGAGEGSLDLSAALAHYAPFASATEPQTVPAAATMTAPAPVLN